MGEECCESHRVDVECHGGRLCRPGRRKCEAHEEAAAQGLSRLERQRIQRSVHALGERQELAYVRWWRETGSNRRSVSCKVPAVVVLLFGAERFRAYSELACRRRGPLMRLTILFLSFFFIAPSATPKPTPAPRVAP